MKGRICVWDLFRLVAGLARVADRLVRGLARVADRLVWGLAIVADRLERGWPGKQTGWYGC